MRRLLIFLAASVLLSGLGAGHNLTEPYYVCGEQALCDVSEYDGPPVDHVREVTIGEYNWNGTIHIREVSFDHNISESVENVSFEEAKGETGYDNKPVPTAVFDGVLEVKSMCHKPNFDMDIEESTRYTLDIGGKDNYSIESCTEHPVRVEYTMELHKLGSGIELIVNQNNLTKTFQSPDFVGMPQTIEEVKESSEPEEVAENSETNSWLDGFTKGLIKIIPVLS